MAERQLPKLNVAGSIPVSRSILAYAAKFPLFSNLPPLSRISVVEWALTRLT